MIKLSDLISYLGEPDNQTGDEYLWQCPYCKDSHRDNLKYNETKGILWCFADNTHAPQVLKDMRKSGYKMTPSSTNSISVEQEKYKRFFTIQKQVDFKWRMIDCNEALLLSKLHLKMLNKKRGIEKSTVKAVKIGIDLQNKRWVIPTFQYSTERSNIILGFEYRPLNFSKDGLTREKGAPTGLAMINSYKPTTEALVVVEGYFDGYALYQHLSEKGQIEYYQIVTPSNGIQSLYKYISQINFSKYKRYYLYVDNDEAGNNTANKIISNYPMFKRIKTKCNCKDFNEHYMKCIKAQSYK